jgi:hypothetical protein
MSSPRRLVLVALTLAAAVSVGGANHAAAAQTTAFVFTTDFETGGLSAIDLDSHAVSPDLSPFICRDARLRWHRGLLYVINRLGCDNILVLDPAHGYSVVRQFSTGNGSNPSDIAFVSPTKAYVTRYELNSILIVNPVTGATLGQIPLTAFADADGIPEMDRMIRVGNRVFVSLQRLDRNGGFQPTDHSSVVVINGDTDEVIDADPMTPGRQAITLQSKNPVTTFAFDPPSGRLLIGCVGRFSQLDGGMEWVNPVALESGGLAITEAALGGDIDDLAWNGRVRSYAIVSDASFNTMLVSWTATNGTKLATLFSPGGFSLADCDINDRRELYVCDNAFTAPGVFVFSTVTDQMIAGPLDTGLPPNQIVFDLAQDAVAVSEVRPAFFAMSQPHPNPARAEAWFSLTLERAARVRLEVFDLFGRRLRDLSQNLPAGISRLSWDLHLDDGRRAEPGLYVIRAKTGQKMVARRMAVVY